MKYTKYSCDFLPCLAKKSRAVGHSAIYQTSPSGQNCRCQQSKKSEVRNVQLRFFLYMGHKYGIPADTPAQPAADPLCPAVFSYFAPLFYRTISIFARGLMMISSTSSAALSKQRSSTSSSFFTIIHRLTHSGKIGRASCRGRVSPYV